MRHRFAPTKSWTTPRFPATVAADPAISNLGAVVLNTKKQPLSHPFPAIENFEKLLDSDEAAALLGIHKKTLQRLARPGEIPGFQIGDLWRFRASTLNE